MSPDIRIYKERGLSRYQSAIYASPTVHPKSTNSVVLLRSLRRPQNVYWAGLAGGSLVAPCYLYLRPGGFPYILSRCGAYAPHLFPPHVPVRAPRAREESDPFYLFSASPAHPLLSIDFAPLTHLLFFSDTPTYSIRPGVGRPPELAPWRGPGGTPVRRTASLAPTLPSSGPGRLMLAFLHIRAPPTARGQVIQFTHS
ncbi:hypothetical protein RSOLAG1IB_09581 [Rhizoctonia solani AG-1 IB]|uniref:Uncharacterized protein n=1 Tax=Thanatephorus cucumeris (strain AG1-IB / isolate 7/3/14) TaxID=1108050 RepID=A0A0B7FVT9_THACB|nr:hypothetical protein RSOLAG1IB_09581 [Rhizoctonia solani AG-1 IB]